MSLGLGSADRRDDNNHYKSTTSRPASSHHTTQQKNTIHHKPNKHYYDQDRSVVLRTFCSKCVSEVIHILYVSVICGSSILLAFSVHYTGSTRCTTPTTRFWCILYIYGIKFIAKIPFMPTTTELHALPEPLQPCSSFLVVN